MHPAIAQVEAYWHGLRESRALPLRSDIDPRGIRRALEYTFILEKIAPGLGRFRLAGQHLNELMGMEVRGMPLTSLFEPEARRDVTDHLTRVFEAPEGVVMQLGSTRSIGRPALFGELLLLPLKSDLGDVSRALGCLVTKGDVGRAPRRFSVNHVRVTPLITQPETTTEVVEPPRPKRREVNYAETREPYTPPRPPVRGRPKLRLVKSDD